MKLMLLFSALVAMQFVNGQRISGLYYGRGESKAGMSYNSYLCELEIVKKGNLITGSLNYYFGHNQYTSKIRGNFLPGTKTIELIPTRIISFFAKGSNAPDCQIDGSLTLYVEGKDTILYGQLNPTDRYANGCPVITIGLVKAKGEELPDSFALAKMNATEYKSQGKPAISESLAAPAAPTVAGIPERPLNIINTIETSEDSVEISLYDNGKIDNDTVTVFLNGIRILHREPLSVQALSRRIALEPGENTLVMFAENLGDIPPNTSLLLLYANNRRYDINLTSTMQTSGAIKVVRKMPGN